MNHAEALQSQCTERYLLGEMSSEEQLEFEEHFFDCRECADDVKAAVAFTDNTRALLQQSESQGHELFGRPAPAEGEDTPSASHTHRSSKSDGGADLIPFLPRGLQPPPALLAAAMLLILCGTAFQSLVVIPDLHRRLADAQSPQAVSWQFLSVSRSSVPVVQLSSDHRWVGLRLSQSFERAFPHYRCELEDNDGRVVQSAVIPAPPKNEELSIILPTSGLPTGEYSLVLSGLESRSGPTAAPEISRYSLKLENKLDNE